MKMRQNRSASITFKSCTLLIVLLVLSTCQSSLVDLEYNRQTFVSDWRDEVIYQVVIDRFYDGDPNNNYHVDLQREAAYHGGDWQGVIDQLDYLEDLGVTALWISPVLRNVEEDAGFASYHGYWTQSFIDPNQHFGDMATLQRMVDACHRRGIKVILDVVTNHIGQLFYYDINRNGQPDIVFFGGGGPGSGSQNGDQGSDLRRASEWDPEFDSRGVQAFTALGENGLAPLEWVEQPALNRIPPEPPEFHNPDWYQRKGRVTVWEDEGSASYQYRRQQEIEGDFPGGLKDLATHKPEVREKLIEVFAYWIQSVGFDGFRIDTLKHQEPEFFDVFAPAIRQYAQTLGKKNFLMFGEAFDGNDELLGSYTHGQGVDSVFYFSAYYRVIMNVFAYGGDPAEAIKLLEERVSPLSQPELVDETAQRLCTLDCVEEACENGLETCINSLKEQGIPRYSNQPKERGPTDVLGSALTSRQLLINFIDNHDVPRFLYSATPALTSADSQAQKEAKRQLGQARLRSALAYQMTMDGIPCVYYGTEQNFAGGPDPSNREDMWRSGFAQNGRTYQYLKALIKVRKAYRALRQGEVIPRWGRDDEAHGGAKLLAFERSTDEDRALVLINTSDPQMGQEDAQSPAPVGWTKEPDGRGMEVGFAAGTVLIDVLNGGEERFTVDDTGRLKVSAPARATRILVPVTP